MIKDLGKGLLTLSNFILAAFHLPNSWRAHEKESKVEEGIIEFMCNFNVDKVTCIFPFLNFAGISAVFLACQLLWDRDHCWIY